MYGRGTAHLYLMKYYMGWIQKWFAPLKKLSVLKGRRMRFITNLRKVMI